MLLFRSLLFSNSVLFQQLFYTKRLLFTALYSICMISVKNNKIYLESIDSDGKTRDKFVLENKSLLKK